MMHRTLPLVLILGILPACADDDPPEEELSGTNAAQLLACSSGELQVDVPLAGAGLDPEAGLTGDRHETYVVSTTQLVVKPDAMSDFGDRVADIFTDIATREGLVAYGFASDEGCNHQRTLTVWSSEEAMFDFMVGEEHTKAMNATLAISDAGRVTHWTATAEEVEALTWDQAVSRMAEVDNSSVYTR